MTLIIQKSNDVLLSSILVGGNSRSKVCSSHSLVKAACNKKTAKVMISFCDYLNKPGTGP
jgi:hypothetical protein